MGPVNGKRFPGTLSMWWIICQPPSYLQSVPSFAVQALLSRFNSPLFQSFVAFLEMDGNAAPPAYGEETSLTEYMWKVRNVRYRSMIHVGKPEDTIERCRQHLECMKDSFNEYSPVSILSHACAAVLIVCRVSDP